jgi:hypothetical protein
LKEQEQGEVWTSNEVLKLGEIQLALIISVNCKHKIVHVELDI